MRPEISPGLINYLGGSFAGCA